MFVRSSFPILYVNSVAASLEFYRDMLGFRVIYTFPPGDDPGFASLFLAESGDKIGLSANSTAVRTPHPERLPDNDSRHDLPPLDRRPRGTPVHPRRHHRCAPRPRPHPRPVLDAGYDKLAVKIPWWDDRKLSYSFPPA